MKMTPIKSSQIDAIGFEKGKLRVRFKSGDTYEYSNVTPEIHEALTSAESVGSFFKTVIRDDPKAFPYRKLEEKEL